VSQEPKPKSRSAWLLTDSPGIHEENLRQLRALTDFTLEIIESKSLTPVKLQMPSDIILLDLLGWHADVGAIMSRIEAMPRAKRVLLTPWPGIDVQALKRPLPWIQLTNPVTKERIGELLEKLENTA